MHKWNTEFSQGCTLISQFILSMQIHLLHFNPWPLGFTNQGKSQISKTPMYKLPFSEQSSPRVILQASCTSLTLHQTYCLLKPWCRPWCSGIIKHSKWKSQMGRQNKQKTQHFSNIFLQAFRQQNLLRAFLHSSTQVSCTCKRTSWHSNTKQTLGHKEHKDSPLRAALSEIGPFPLPHSQSVLINIYFKQNQHYFAEPTFQQ